MAYPDRGRLALTEAGERETAMVETPPSVEEYQDYLLRLVSGPQARLLRYLIEIYPAAESREDLAAACEVSPLSSGFEKNIATLSSFGFVEYPQRGYVAAAPLVFLE